MVHFSSGRRWSRPRRLAFMLTACLALLGATALTTAATSASASPAVRAVHAGTTAHAGSTTAAGDTTSVPPLNHVFLIMEENNGFSDIIGNPAAPNLNYLASTFGLETNYFGVSPCC